MNGKNEPVSSAFERKRFGGGDFVLRVGGTRDEVEGLRGGESRTVSQPLYVCAVVL